MKFNYCEDDKITKPKVICVEYDGDISCFELGNLPPPPKDPKKFGILFPCCVRDKKQLINQKTTKSDNAQKESTKHEKDFCCRKARPNNVKRATTTDGKDTPLASNTSNAVNSSIIYVFDKNGFNKVISFAKANIDCGHLAELNTKELVDKRRNPHEEATVAHQKQLVNSFFNMGKPLGPCKSRELRGGILSTDCYCLRRNGLQYDCRRTGCQNSPQCSVLPAPVCEPARVACITHCANPHAAELSSICKLRPW